MSFWLLFISNSRWHHKSYMSKWWLRRTNITAGYWAACWWRRFLEIRSTSISEERDLRILWPTWLLLRSVEPRYRTLDTMNDIAYCPKPECLSPTVRQDINDNNAICGQCRYEFCIKCEKGSHEGQSSTDPRTIRRWRIWVILNNLETGPTNLCKEIV